MNLGPLRKRGGEVPMSAQSATGMDITETLVKMEILKTKKYLHYWLPKEKLKRKERLKKRPRLAPVANQIEVAQTCLPIVPYDASCSQLAIATVVGLATKMKKKKDKKHKGSPQATTMVVPTSGDSPAMGTRSKKKGNESPAMGTRSKKRLSDFL